MAELADFLGLERSTMSGLIARAEQRGLVERRRHPDDARATQVAMTPAGLRLAEQVYAEVHAALTAHIPAAERATVVRALTGLPPAPLSPSGPDRQEEAPH